jgi:amidophosphoribosyltransferase
MSDAIKHECGIAMIRLLKPLDYYKKKYGTYFYGLNKLCLLMEKQHNRGQDGAGIASIKLDMAPGHKYISLERSNSATPIKDVFGAASSEIMDVAQNYPEQENELQWYKNNVRFCGELFLGHLRYGTFGKNSIESCHPFLRENNWMTRNLVTAGNFNLTNIDSLFNVLLGIGQHPKEYSDTVTILEKIGHFLDEENNLLVRKFKEQGFTNRQISPLVAEHLDVLRILKNTCRKWDGGYTMCGLIGHGDAFVIRDPAGIRPCWYYHDDEVVVVTSERPPIQTAFNIPCDDVKELPPANALIIKKNGKITVDQFTRPLKKKACSFERIYFSRGSDRDIYRERKQLGKSLVPAILEEIEGDMDNTVFSFIPNTAETCFLGMIDELTAYCQTVQLKKLLFEEKNWTPRELEQVVKYVPRFEKVAVKDAKLRTFISDDSQRNELAAHVYDITYGVIRQGTDTLVIIDDSIVRGTTMRESILRILDRAGPKKVIVVSSAPQIRYPDCYGIDMARLGKFIAFEAAVELLKETGQEALLDKVYRDAKEQLDLPMSDMVNVVKQIYEPFGYEKVSDKISQMLRPEEMKAELKFIYQTVDSLHLTCPDHLGDWYFTGDYPTPGGNKVVNQAYVNYIDGNNQRAY